ncbi:Uncharacterised protein [uncultured archaeon]|nr:Uncharacterised protein [uncultured archaeon]
MGNYSIAEVGQAVDVIYAAQLVYGRYHHYCHQIGGQSIGSGKCHCPDNRSQQQSHHWKHIDMPHEGLDALHGDSYRYGGQPSKARLERKDKVLQGYAPFLVLCCPGIHVGRYSSNKPGYNIIHEWAQTRQDAWLGLVVADIIE